MLKYDDTRREYSLSELDFDTIKEVYSSTMSNMTKLGDLFPQEKSRKKDRLDIKPSVTSRLSGKTDVRLSGKKDRLDIKPSVTSRLSGKTASIGNLILDMRPSGN